MKWELITSIVELRGKINVDQDKIIIAGFVLDPNMSDMYVQFIKPLYSKKEIMKVDKYEYYYTSLSSLRKVNVDLYNKALNILDGKSIQVKEVKSVLKL